MFIFLFVHSGFAGPKGEAGPPGIIFTFLFPWPCITFACDNYQSK